MTPPELIRAAADAMRKTLEDPRYWFSGRTFHESDANGTVIVCLAGCWMVQHLKAEPTEYLCPEDFPQHQNLLHALDNINFGYLANAARFLKVQRPAGVPKEVTPLYDLQPNEYLRRLEEIATMWENADK